MGPDHTNVNVDVRCNIAAYALTSTTSHSHRTQLVFSMASFVDFTLSAHNYYRTLHQC